MVLQFRATASIPGSHSPIERANSCPAPRFHRTTATLRQQVRAIAQRAIEQGRLRAGTACRPRACMRQPGRVAQHRAVGRAAPAAEGYVRGPRGRRHLRGTRPWPAPPAPRGLAGAAPGPVAARAVDGRHGGALAPPLAASAGLSHWRAEVASFRLPCGTAWRARPAPASAAARITWTRRATRPAPGRGAVAVGVARHPLRCGAGGGARARSRALT